MPLAVVGRRGGGDPDPGRAGRGVRLARCALAEPADFVVPVACPAVLLAVAGIVELQSHIGRQVWQWSGAGPSADAAADFDEGEAGGSSVREAAREAGGCLGGCASVLLAIPLWSARAWRPSSPRPSRARRPNDGRSPRCTARRPTRMASASARAGCSAPGSRPTRTPSDSRAAIVPPARRRPRPHPPDRRLAAAPLLRGELLGHRVLDRPGETPPPGRRPLGATRPPNSPANRPRKPAGRGPVQARIRRTMEGAG